SRRYPVLKRLSTSLQRLVAEDARPVQMSAGVTIFDVEGSCSQFMLLTSGSLRVVKPAVSGREILLYRVLPGDSCILTASCLLGHRGYPARGETESEVAGAVLSAEAFRLLVQESPPFREFVYQFFADRIVRLMSLVEGVAVGQLDQRLASALLARSADGRTVVETTHQQLADEVGSVREVVSRTLKEFETRELLHLERGQVRLLDRRGLELMADPKS
ncbi:MAG: Crp/Fnr family transcriptional regulator, partial [Caldilineaceae bacterium]